MAWIQIRINATKQNADQISDYLMDCGSASVTFLDTNNTPIYEPPIGEVILWADTTVIGLFDASEDMQAVVDYLSEQPELVQTFDYKIEQLEDKDWEREWMDNFHPIKFGERLWICPSWREIPDPTAVNVLLDPGLAFGTGTHATTALCLEWLESLDLTGKTVVDFGCGSGILGIAAIKLGAARVIGIDIDPQALEASLDNAQRNGVAHQLEVYLPQDQPEFMADVMVANILAAPLRELHGVILGLLKPQGAFALSGILVEQADSVANVYQEYCQLDAIAEQGEWVRVSGIKN
ncbi:50S ribosomal protein L11 methyltransferase [Pseudoalteromonas tunicata]|uniref:50S ribosomal protein L11 methyltransferase n=1 Tax=Pseudoalteromonas tunicata TaxID=314281 RepID=UPI00273D161B|nr:50S ribosomal protein L11 methyltransferase [Pseudoalteromonas tunicata]MDP4984088.1 50S ribosomal protein L11 methyltransferase [Pseudoalteromonas tunicata]MDP5214388.1 50S ribosomal protein L11 methyltransferase [Pseudoalteromonas tunicata]